MEKTSFSAKKTVKRQKSDFADTILKESFLFAETVIDTNTHAYLILDKELSVLAANNLYYALFKDSKNKALNVPYTAVGGGFFNIPSLKKKVQQVAKNEYAFFKGFEIKVELPKIGKKTFLISARNIYSQSDDESIPSEMIVLGVEDATELMEMADFIVKEYKNAKKK